MADHVEWVIAECDEEAASRLADQAGVPRAIARLLVNRGVSTHAEALNFLNPSLDHLHDPSLLPDLDAGVERVAAALAAGEKICVHGDYDVDGVTSTALLVRTLRALGGNADYRLPHRRREGYDIKPAAVDQAAAGGVSVILTCDCGIGAHDAVERARRHGIDVIVTDHHEPGPDLPPALAVVNPRRHDAEYPFPELAGVGVAYKFAQGLVRKLGLDEEAFKVRFLDLAALGTVGDVVPLLGENRAIVKFGLDAIPQTKKLGLQMMLRTSRLEGRPLTTYALGYVIGPRINAAGRMDDATAALRLFLTKDESEALELANLLERHNYERRAEQERIFGEAVEQVESKDLDSARVLVLSREGWNSGVIGVVAGKICELYGRPAILISRNETRGVGVGSARSVEAFHILDGLRHCESLLTRFGGHALAAGLSIPLDNIGPFEERINELAFERIPEEELVPRVVLDAELQFGEVTRELAEALASMEPFGCANPEPVFVTRSLSVMEAQRVGDGSHLKMLLGTDGCSPLPCIFFGIGDGANSILSLSKDQLGGTLDMCYSVRLDSFNGVESVQLVGKAMNTRC